MEPQSLPRCYRHPHLPCPGECQYILPQDECLNERGEPQDLWAGIKVWWGREEEP